MENLFEKLSASLPTHPLLIYSKNSRVIPAGAILSNEINRYAIEIPSGPSDCFVGFGTSANWDIASVRRSKFLLLIDLSVDVILAHLFFYRPLFLISDTRADFAAHFSGKMNAETKKLAAVFSEWNSPSDEKAFEQFLLEKKTIEDERQFILAIVRSAGLWTGAPGPFKKLHLERPLKELFRILYDEKENAKANRLFRIFLRPKNFSMLGSEENYAHVRDLYRQNKVRFALSDVEDKGLYEAIRQFLQKEGHGVSDLYVSNIPMAIKGYEASSKDSLLTIFENLPWSKGGAFLYETTNTQFPFKYATHEHIES